jgi:hypothetical protein
MALKSAVAIVQSRVCIVTRTVVKGCLSKKNKFTASRARRRHEEILPVPQLSLPQMFPLVMGCLLCSIQALVSLSLSSRGSPIIWGKGSIGSLFGVRGV